MRRNLIGAAIATGVVALGPAWSASGASQPAGLESGKVLFAPDLAAHPQEGSGYPRLVRLEHSGAANGTVLATFTHDGGEGPGSLPRPKASLPIYRSDDGGVTWTPQPIGTVTDTVHGWDIVAPALFELPEAQGDLPAGTLFAAGTAWNRGDFRQQALMVYVSRDQGVSWSYRSACASESLQVNTKGHGLWEPQFVITADGSLNCFFSDERPSSDGFAQVIAHVRSTDGGATWGPEIFDVAVRDGVQRPGMPTVVRLPNGTYAMTLEDCMAGHDADQVCTDYLKVSPDGQDWTPVSKLGSLVTTADGHRLLHTPTLAWSPAGGPQGTLIVSGQRVVTGPEGQVTVLPQSGRVVMINTGLGTGPWREIDTPFVIDPTGGYGPGETHCPGYSSPVLPAASPSDSSFIFMASAGVPNGKCEIRYGTGSLRKATRSKP